MTRASCILVLLCISSCCPENSKTPHGFKDLQVQEDMLSWLKPQEKWVRYTVWFLLPDLFQYLFVDMCSVYLGLYLLWLKIGQMNHFNWRRALIYFSKHLHNFTNRENSIPLQEPLKRQNLEDLLYKLTNYKSENSILPQQPGDTENQEKNRRGLDNLRIQQRQFGCRMFFWKSWTYCWCPSLVFKLSCILLKTYYWPMAWYTNFCTNDTNLILWVHVNAFLLSIGSYRLLETYILTTLECRNSKIFHSPATFHFWLLFFLQLSSFWLHVPGSFTGACTWHWRWELNI